jgi:hypothetical protein
MAFIKNILQGFLGLKKDPNVTTQDTAVIKAEDTNSGIAIVPNGTGAITARVPNGTNDGGLARGSYAVDLQMGSFNQTKVAAGNYSVTLGFANKSTTTYGFAVGYNNLSDGVASISMGSGNVASSDLSTVSGGQSNTASTNSHATVVGGNNNTSSGKYSVSGGRGNTASGLGAVAIGGGFAGTSATASNSESFAMGQNAQATNIQSFAFGYQQKAYLHHGFVHGFTRFGTGRGQYQDTTVQVEDTLTTGGTTNLLKDSAYPLQGSGLIPDGNDRAWNVTVEYIGVCTAAGSGTTAVGDVVTGTDKFRFKRVGGTSTIGSVTNIELTQDATMTSAVCTYAVGGSNDLQITFAAPTTANATTFRVVAKVSLVEVAW